MIRAYKVMQTTPTSGEVIEEITFTSHREAEACYNIVKANNPSWLR